jgi:elongation factor G
LLGGQEHERDSSEVAFETAAKIALEEALKQAGPVMLEPVMKLEVSVPDAYFGAVSGDLGARRGLIQDTELRSPYRIIHARVPLAEMFEYATALRTLTQGRANHSLEPFSYQQMPAGLQKELLRRHGYIE